MPMCQNFQVTIVLGFIEFLFVFIFKWRNIFDNLMAHILSKTGALRVKGSLILSIVTYSAGTSFV